MARIESDTTFLGKCLLQLQLKNLLIFPERMIFELIVENIRLEREVGLCKFRSNRTGGAGLDLELNNAASVRQYINDSEVFTIYTIGISELPEHPALLVIPGYVPCKWSDIEASTIRRRAVYGARSSDDLVRAGV